jgi:hypothetical protein
LLEDLLIKVKTFFETFFGIIFRYNRIDGGEGRAGVKGFMAPQNIGNAVRGFTDTKTERMRRYLNLKAVKVFLDTGVVYAQELV